MSRIFSKNKSKVLLLEDGVREGTEICNRINQIKEELKRRDLNIELSESYNDLNDIITIDKNIDCLLISWPDNKNECHIVETIKQLNKSQPGVPVFLLTHKKDALEKISREVYENIEEIIWLLQENIVFLGQRIETAVNRYNDELLPPLTKAVFNYNKVAEYSWAAPGHQGGVGFTKTALGRRFFDFYDENLFRTDTGIERTSIGSLLDHSGAFLEGEKRAAKIFGADRSYNVLVGTSGSNRTVIQGVLTDEDIALVDRNCHKSIEQGLMITGAKPVYMKPTRNRYGIIGPILPIEMSQKSVKEKIINSPLVPESMKKQDPEYVVVTNCTYDGVCYNAKEVEDIFQPYIKRIHFDEAWYGYAKFNPIYADHFAMRGSPDTYKGDATVFATQSTHKLLNALSQSSYVHLRQGKDIISEERFNQAYMMHATTSPLYAIAVSNEVGAAMMDGDTGTYLTDEVIREAIEFRQMVAKYYKEYKEDGEWFFKPWNGDIYVDSNTGKSYEFYEAPIEMLMKDQNFWTMKPGESWHGFENIPADWIMLDPIKVSILSPGMEDSGEIGEGGVPAELISYYFSKYGVVPTRTTDFQIMFLFSMGISKGKWGTLLDLLVSFKKDYDRNMPLKEIFPELVQGREERYGHMGMKDLGEEIFKYLKENDPGKSLNEAYSNLPEQIMTPREAYNKIVTNDVELVPASKLQGRVSANAVMPYPPGIPMLMSGESFGDKNSAQIKYLKVLSTWDKEFPGFEKETEGTAVVNGEYCVLCVK
ncbi:Orn/Lys/Arg decarboxylase N-terminal domain-containing protein [uncultured Cetobacterium sp.]|uniref:Orn/Lys/Arg family decarboxylase n=1 Tax=uncultured Cetobacterium sp. TaxID=527638 RepID=UPI002632CD24|nr:Orn/Lys/Arg decarboxylase N-terminal domain-containing protein [uncultured Cetobacterium sp.]